MNESCSLGRQDAVRLWNSVAPTLGVAIANEIRKMGLPKVRDYAPSPEMRRRVRARKVGDVRLALLRDTSLHEDIAQTAAAQFFAAVERGRVPGSASTGWVFRIAQRATWRMATARATEHLQALDARYEGADAADLLQAPDDVEAAAGRQLGREPLLRAFATFTDAEVPFLEAKLEGEGAYARLAAELGWSVGRVRVKAHRLWKRLLAEFEAQSVKRRDKGTGHATGAKKPRKSGRKRKG